VDISEKDQPADNLDPGAVRGQLEIVLASTVFQGATRSSKLLRFLVEYTVQGKTDELKEYTLGSAALGRGESFDPRTDPIARVEASRLRGRLDHYYATEGQSDLLWIVLPKGGYIPKFEVRQPIDSTHLVRERPDDGNSKKWKITAVLSLTGFAVAIIAWWAPWRHTVSDPLPAVRLEVDLGPAASLSSSQVGSSNVIISPDARRLVFVSFRKDGGPRLMTRRLDLADRAETSEMPGTDGARGPFFSPDGEWVAFWAGGKLKKIQVESGTPIPLCDAADLLGGSWGNDGSIVAALSATGLFRIPSGGGTPEPIAGFEHTLAYWPQVLPGGKAVLLTIFAAVSFRPSVAILSLTDHKVRVLVDGATYGRYLPGGYLAYVDQGTLFVAPFDADRLEVTGKRVALFNDVSFASGFGSADFDVSRTGLLVYRRRMGGSKSTLWWLEKSGASSPMLLEPAEYLWPKVSPDGSRVVFSKGEVGQQTLWVYEWRSGKLTQVASGGGIYSGPLWTRDGRFLLVSGPNGMRWLGADGGGEPRLLDTSADAQIPWSFDPSGGRLAFYQRGLSPNGSGTFDLWTMPVSTNGGSIISGKPEPFLVSDAFELYPSFSPDGHWMSYTSLESGAYEVYVRAFPDSGRKWQVSSNGGNIPRWSPDGRRLFYRTNDHRIMVVNYTASVGAFHGDEPRVWRDMPLADTGVLPNFDVAPDGRIAAMVPMPDASEHQDERHVTFVMNFLDEVRRRTLP
jgi:Tol biopolymer transport system component